MPRHCLPLAITVRLSSLQNRMHKSDLTFARQVNAIVIPYLKFHCNTIHIETGTVQAETISNWIDRTAHCDNHSTHMF
jgi:hypothetical protein